ncbi:hypothetical protein MAR_036155 [Mya arenaria]|uniref:Uncharacterized protein n=1 Tax=Mya arenaria TaxID=6604 RepID=A0ABY7EQ51_MYAAR|nr:hypothetical protein MAR_036155 [Mya arenaria]
MCDYSLLNSFFGCLESLCPTEFAKGQVGAELINCENYNALKYAFNTARVSQCTCCGFPENVYNQGIFETDFRVIDHIFSSKGIRISDPQRMFLPLDADTTTSGADGNRPLSDHNGAMAEVRYCVGYFQRWSQDPGPCPFIGLS